jgi:hypothetical protein
MIGDPASMAGRNPQGSDECGKTCVKRSANNTQPRSFPLLAEGVRQPGDASHGHTDGEF